MKPSAMPQSEISPAASWISVAVSRRSRPIFSSAFQPACSAAAAITTRNTEVSKRDLPCTDEDAAPTGGAAREAR